MSMSPQDVTADLLGRRFDRAGAALADPPWRFDNRSGKIAPEYKRMNRYSTLNLDQIKSLPVDKMTLPQSHLYLWVPNALVAQGLDVMTSWGFTYKTVLIWYKVRRDHGPDGRGVGFYFRNVTEMLLFGVKGNLRTLKPGRTQVNLISSQRRAHSRKPDQVYEVIEACSPGPYLELFARYKRPNWSQWGDQIT